MVLENILAGDVNRKVASMSVLIHQMGTERFGVIENRSSRHIPRIPHNRRTMEIASIRGDLRRLRIRYKAAPDEEKVALEQLRTQLRERLKLLRRAELNRRKRKEREKRRTQFTANPFQFVSRMLGAKRSGTLECTQQEVEDYICQMNSDPS